MTPVQQQTDVGEGLAVGCLAIGVQWFTSARMPVEFAFGRAWPSWAWASSFPSIKTSLQRNDIIRILSRSERRRSAFIAAWKEDRVFTPYLFDSERPISEAAELVELSCGVPLAGWMELATLFVNQLRDHEFFIEQPEKLVKEEDIDT